MVYTYIGNGYNGKKRPEWLKMIEKWLTSTSVENIII